MPSQHNQEFSIPEMQPAPNQGDEAPKKHPESAPETSRGEMISQAVSAVSQAQNDDVNTIVVDENTKTIAQPIQSQATNPQIADDVDVIEKEWVAKAKEIVLKTRDDPHSQSSQLMIFRHDYMKKRYGKEIKLPDEQAA